MNQSKLPKLLEQVRTSFPENQLAHSFANWALKELAKKSV